MKLEGKICPINMTPCYLVFRRSHVRPSKSQRTLSNLPEILKTPPKCETFRHKLIARFIRFTEYLQNLQLEPAETSDFQ